MSVRILKVGRSISSETKILMSSHVFLTRNGEIVKIEKQNWKPLVFQFNLHKNMIVMISCQNTVMGNAVIHGLIIRNIHLLRPQFTQVTWTGDLYRPFPEIMQHLMYWSILAKENIYVNAVLDNGLWDNCFINVHRGKHFALDSP